MTAKEKGKQRVLNRLADAHVDNTHTYKIFITCVVLGECPSAIGEFRAETLGN